jgi:hypothetical protein
MPVFFAAVGRDVCCPLILLARNRQDSLAFVLHWTVPVTAEGQSIEWSMGPLPVLRSARKCWGGRWGSETRQATGGSVNSP